MEKILAQNLKKMQQNARNKNLIPIELQKKQNIEEIKYYKQELKKACKNKSVENAEKSLDKLLKLRANQIKILTKDQNLNNIQIEQLVKNYFDDCRELIMSTKILLN
jgi:hypothetical protein